jgi:hypothetical protein
MVTQEGQDRQTCKVFSAQELQESLSGHYRQIYAQIVTNSSDWRNQAWVLKKSVNRNDLLVPKIAFRVLFLFR